jgi:uncharacterized protein YcnI
MRSLKTLLGAAVLVLAVATPAAAHVTVQPPEATQGGYAKLAFRVPNEKESANTTKLEVQLPTNAKFNSISTKPLPGWTVTKTDTTITWEGGKITPGEFQEFEISVGPLPTNVDTLEFKALQTYDDGDVVRWIEPRPASGEEPEHPAPTLKLVDSATATTGAPEVTAPSSSDDGNGGVVGAYVVGALGVLLGGAALVLSRRRPST